MTAENNLLHRQIIEVKEAADAQQRQHAVGARALEAQLSQSLLLVTAANERAAAAERAFEGLKRRLSEIAGLQKRYEQGGCPSGVRHRLARTDPAVRALRLDAAKGNTMKGSIMIERR